MLFQFRCRHNMAVDDSYTKALLHMDGSDASTTFTDESGKTWTANGNAQIDTAQSKFGGASGLFDGTGDWIDTPDSADFTLGSGDFTIDMWLKRGADGVTQYFCGQNNSSATEASTSFQIALHATNKLYSYWFWGSSAGNYETIIGTTTVNVALGWFHVAFVRSGNTLTQYINGVADGTANLTGKTINNSSNKFALGRIGEYTSNTYNGWIDEFRFSKGIARWTANFTPPTSAYAPAATSNFFPFF